MMKDDKNRAFSGCVPVDAHWEPGEEDDELARLAKALGHPVRAQIVRFLAAQDTCMYGDLAGHLPLAQSTVSQHLKILKEAGLVRGTIDGPRVCYCIEPEALERLRKLIGALAAV